MKLTIALYVTLLRIAMTPFVVLAFLQQQYICGLILFCIAAATDLLDGYVARHFNCATFLGKILDPIADKILLTSVMLTLLYILNLSEMLFLSFCFLVTKEIVLLFGGLYILSKHTQFIEPSILSRFVCFVEIALVLTLLLSTGLVNIPAGVIFALIMVNIISSLSLLVRYLLILIRMRN